MRALHADEQTPHLPREKNADRNSARSRVGKRIARCPAGGCSGKSSVCPRSQRTLILYFMVPIVSSRSAALRGKPAGGLLRARGEKRRRRSDERIDCPHQSADSTSSERLASLPGRRRRTRHWCAADTCVSAENLKERQPRLRRDGGAAQAGGARSTEDRHSTGDHAVAAVSEGQLHVRISPKLSGSSFECAGVQLDDVENSVIG
jgi:hypothetical protein